MTQLNSHDLPDAEPRLLSGLFPVQVAASCRVLSVLAQTQVAVRELQGAFDTLGNTGPSFPPACSEVVVISAIKSEGVIVSK